MEKSIIFSDYNTVINDVYGEVTTDNFFEMVKRDINTNKVRVTYSENESKISLYLNNDSELEEEHSFILDEVDSENYKRGLYTPNIAKFQELIILSNQISAKKSLQMKSLEEKNKILEGAKKGKIPTEEARQLYLEYLQNESKPSLKKIGNFFQSVNQTLKKTSKETKRILLKILSHYDQIFEVFVIFSFVSLVISTSAYIVIKEVILETGCTSWLYTILLGTLSPWLLTSSVCLTSLVKSIIEEINKSIQNKNLIKTKIKELTNLRVNTQTVNISKTIQTEENNKENIESAKVTSALFLEIYKLADKIKGIDSKNKQQEFALRITDLLNELNTKMDSIDHKTVGKFGVEDPLSVKADTIKAISGINKDIDDYMKVESEKLQRQSETRVIQASMEVHTEKGTNHGVARALQRH